MINNKEVNFGDIIEDKNGDIYLIKKLYNKTWIHKHPYVVLLKLEKKWSICGYGIKIHMTKIKLTKEEFYKNNYRILCNLETLET